MNLNTTINIDLKGFFRWWGRELAFLVPKKLRHLLRDRSGRLIFTPVGSGFDVEFFDDEDNVIVRRRIEVGDSVAYPELKRQYPAVEKAEFILRLPAQQAMQRVIFLPAAVQENLAQVVSFELDRYTPFKADQVYFNAVLFGQTGHGQISALLIVVPKGILDEQLELLQAADIKIHRVDYQPAFEQFAQSRHAYNLLPERYRQQGSKLSQSAHWLASGLFLLLLIFVLVLPIWMGGQAVEMIRSRLKQLENQNRVVEVEQKEIDALHEETQYLIDIKHQSPALLPVLRELSKLLNDETWLTHLRFSGQRIQIQGQSPAASGLIRILESSDYFNNVSFVSPLTQDKTTGRERFQISMDVTMPVSVGPAAQEQDSNANTVSQPTPSANFDEPGIEPAVIEPDTYEEEPVSE
ncbi:MAG: PilN domain-containing protein [Gammaproteobacteria bacterium]